MSARTACAACSFYQLCHYHTLGLDILSFHLPGWARAGKSCTRHTRCVRTFLSELRTFWFRDHAHMSRLQICEVILTCFEVNIEEFFQLFPVTGVFLISTSPYPFHWSDSDMSLLYWDACHITYSSSASQEYDNEEGLHAEWKWSGPPHIFLYLSMRNLMCRQQTIDMDNKCTWFFLTLFLMKGNLSMKPTNKLP